jgi:hypothetical protein
MLEIEENFILMGVKIQKLVKNSRAFLLASG